MIQWLGPTVGPKQDIPPEAVFSFGDYQWWWSDSLTKVADWWADAPGNIFLSKPYLAALAAAPPSGLQCSYLLALEQQQVVAGFLIQELPFRGDQAVKSIREATGTGLADRLRRWLSRLGNFRVLVLGNLLLTGEHAYWRQNQLEHRTWEQLFQQAAQVFERLARQKKIRSIMIKDFLERQEYLARIGFHALDFQPTMLMDLPPQWKSFDDYLEVLSSKYRVRVRRAIKKAQGLQWRELDLRQLDIFGAEIERLYHAVIDQADFNMLQVDARYFYELKAHLDRDFELIGCFQGERLIGFFTTIRNGAEMECHFIGLHPEINRMHQVYLNMLLKMIEQGIRWRVKRISFARTALEIKSSVGAQAFPLYAYLKHRYPLLNRILPLVVRFMEPKEPWVPRHPFHQ